MIQKFDFLNSYHTESQLKAREIVGGGAYKVGVLSKKHNQFEKNEPNSFFRMISKFHNNIIQKNDQLIINNC